MQSGQHDDVHIEHLHEHDPSGDITEPVWLFFNRAQKQNGERPEESPNNQEHAQRPPRFGISNEEILRLLRQVSIPDEHVLAEADVGTENEEDEHPFSHDWIKHYRNSYF